jgi:hypothetical protein
MIPTGRAGRRLRRQAEVDALGGNVPPYDVTDVEGQQVALAAYMQWTADRYATGLADCDGPICGGKTRQAVDIFESLGMPTRLEISGQEGDRDERE